MRRKIYNQLLDWKEKRSQKEALLIDGARRVGKSWIVEEFARREFKSYILIDFSEASATMLDVFRLIVFINYICSIMLRRYCFILSVTLLLFFDAVSLSAGNLVVKNRRASWKSIDVNQIDTSRYAFFDYLSPDSACVYYGSLGRNGAVIIGNKSWVADNPDKDIYARDLADSFRKYFIRDIVVTLICALFWLATIIGVLFSIIRSRRREQLICLDNQIEPVSIKLRIINFVIDTCIVSALLRLHMIIVIILLTFVVRADVFDSMLLPYLLSFLSVKIWIYVCYFFYSEFLSGRTFGKRMTSTTIVNECGEKPTAKAILVRTICRLIPLDFCSCFFYREQLKKGQYIFWHDKFSHTRVVKSVQL